MWMCLWAQSMFFSLNLSDSLFGRRAPTLSSASLWNSSLLWHCPMDSVDLSRRGCSLPHSMDPWDRILWIPVFPFFLYPFTHVTPFVLVLLSRKDIQCLDPALPHPSAHFYCYIFCIQQGAGSLSLEPLFLGPISQTLLLSLWSAISALKALNQLCNCVSILWVWIQLLPLAVDLALYSGCSILTDKEDDTHCTGWTTTFSCLLTWFDFL